jgi:hypothetical protein
MTVHKYSLRHGDMERDSGGNYQYEILNDSGLVARYWHDYRGIEFLNGISENSPIGRMADFLIGGGPLPLDLSKAAEDYLAEKLEQ